MGQAPDEDVTPASSSAASEPLDPDTRVEVETLKVEIEQTRSGIGETLQALEERLTPGNLASDAAAAVKDKAARTMEALGISFCDIMLMHVQTLHPQFCCRLVQH